MSCGHAGACRRSLWGLKREDGAYRFFRSAPHGEHAPPRWAQLSPAAARAAAIGSLSCQPLPQATRQNSVWNAYACLADNTHQHWLLRLAPSRSERPRSPHSPTATPQNGLALSMRLGSMLPSRTSPPKDVSRLGSLSLCAYGHRKLVMAITAMAGTSTIVVCRRARMATCHATRAAKGGRRCTQ